MDICEDDLEVIIRWVREIYTISDGDGMCDKEESGQKFVNLDGEGVRCSCQIQYWRE